jgi:hypothetical protein
LRQFFAAALLTTVAGRAQAQVVDSAKSTLPSAAGSTGQASADTNVVRSFGGYVDTYYGWDFDRPSRFDRAYTTQPARHAEANVNLAYVETRLSGPRYRGRLALQWGTSVQANYAGEPKIGGTSGPNVSQFIQEATLGYQLGSAVWLDAGIFFAHIGYEGWISRDNLSYTRSLVADFSPYYEAGAKLTWTASPKLTAMVALINGWQNISNYNTPPAAGIRVDYMPTPKITLTYDNFVGNTAADSEPVRMRIYHDLIAQYNPSGRWQFATEYSLGTQGRSTPSGGTASWWGMTTFAKYHATPTLSIVGRVEEYSDPSQVIVVTGLPASFQTTGASLGVDVNFQAPILWRSELRGFRSKEPVWPLNGVGHFGRNDAFFVSSLALTF